MRTDTHRSPTSRPHRARRRRSRGVAWGALAALAGALAVAACSTQPMTDETGKWQVDGKGGDCENNVIGRIHSTLEWKKNYLPGDFFHGDLSDDWYLCDQQLIEHKDGVLSLICIWCSTVNTRWKLIQESCAGQLYRFVPRRMTAADDAGPPEVTCLTFVDVSSQGGTLDTEVSSDPATLGQLAAFEAGLVGIEDINVNALSASMTFSLPDTVGGFVVSGDAFGIGVTVNGTSESDPAHQVLEFGRGSTVTVTGPLLQAAGWAWYAGLSELETSAGTTSVHLQFHDTLPLVWISLKSGGGDWMTLTGKDGQPVSWWLDPCALTASGCSRFSIDDTGAGR